jgi:L,D-peptidoglycan transpeptidase YkuD (ErfK/YbiS/YcfS/YnhG family)
MTVARVLSACLASAAVAGCAVAALGMSRTATRPTHESTAAAELARQTRPVVLPMSRAAGAAGTTGSSLSSATASSSAARPSAARPSGSSTPSSVGRSSAPASVVALTSAAPPTRARAASTARTSSAAAQPAAARLATTTTALVQGRPLPLRFRTGTATRVITVTASSTRSTTARLQAWTKASGGGWLAHGSAVTAHVGADGLSTQPSEYRSATPIGSFTLTHAFGHDTNPGTTLPYLHTRPSDWWISQAGPLYNTHQRCASSCAFRQGSPNEHLYYETPYYNYAVVIDYNTRNAPGGVVQGAGSAFFLHVYPAGTGPTAGCVAIGQAKLISLLRWLTPTAHPRILIGVG